MPSHSASAAYPDVQRLSWSECSDWDGTACVIGMPHDTDPLKVGMAVSHTETGADGDPRPDDVTEVKKTWGYILTVREQWDYQCVAIEGAQGDVGEPPAKWWPSESVPGWQECAEDHPRAEPIWIVRWAS